jgi:hypothetical protein
VIVIPMMAIIRLSMMITMMIMLPTII